MSVLKTTQSGYEGYLKDKYTVLKETKERMMATTITCTWKCALPSRIALICMTMQAFVPEVKHNPGPCLDFK